MNLFKLLKDDLQHKSVLLYSSSSFKYLMRALFADATLSMFFYRIMQWTYQYKSLRVFTVLVSKANSIICGAVIGCGAEFGEKFVIIHSVGVVINSKVKAGSEILIESGVVIGDEKGKAPKIGNNVFIGSGAKIFGDINIGDNVKVGANAVINKDVPNNVTAVGIPARYIKR